MILIAGHLLISLPVVSDALRTGMPLQLTAAVIAGTVLGRLLPENSGQAICEFSVRGALLRCAVMLGWVPFVLPELRLPDLRLPPLLQVLYASGVISVLLRQDHPRLKGRVKNVITGIRSRFARPGPRAHS